MSTRVKEKELYEAMLESGLNQSKLAEKSNLSFYTINKVIKHKIAPSNPTAFKIAKALNVKVKDIFFTDGIAKSQ